MPGDAKSELAAHNVRGGFDQRLLKLTRFVRPCVMLPVCTLNFTRVSGISGNKYLVRMWYILMIWGVTSKGVLFRTVKSTRQ